VSLDLSRGLIMMLMALDHTRDYFSGLPFPSEDPSNTFGTLFFTRVITHVCAAVFLLLAGAGAYLPIAQGKSLQRVPCFFFGHVVLNRAVAASHPLGNCRRRSDNADCARILMQFAVVQIQPD
jgi:uncharacterized membrane protein